MTTQNNILNFRTARRMVGQRLFGPAFDGTVAAYAALSPADQVRLNDEIAYYIAFEANDASFSDGQRTVAYRITQRPHFRTPLADAGFSWGEFGNEVVAEAGKISVNFVATLSKVAAVAAVGVALYYLWRAKATA